MQCQSRSRLRIVATFVLALTALFNARVKASTVVEMPVAELADHAGEVIVGEVASVRSFWADNPRRMESEVTWRSIEYLKGGGLGRGTSFSLVVPGGKIGDTRMEICCAPQFRVGQSWMLFLLPIYKTFPVVGLYQGAFRIVRDANGEQRVTSASGLSVTGIDAGGFVRSAGRVPSSARSRLADAHHARLLPSSSNRAVAGPVSLAEFRAVLQPILDRSRRYSLHSPAGRRALVQYTPVPFRAGLQGATTDGIPITPSVRGTHDTTRARLVPTQRKPRGRRSSAP